MKKFSFVGLYCITVGMQELELMTHSSWPGSGPKDRGSVYIPFLQPSIPPPPGPFPAQQANPGDPGWLDSSACWRLYARYLCHNCCRSAILVLISCLQLVEGRRDGQKQYHY